MKKMESKLRVGVLKQEPQPLTSGASLALTARPANQLSNSK